MITADEARLIKAEEVQKITNQEKEKIFLEKLKDIERGIKFRSREGFYFYVVGNGLAVIPVEKELTEALTQAGYKVKWCRYAYASNPLYTVSWEEK